MVISGDNLAGSNIPSNWLLENHLQMALQWHQTKREGDLEKKDDKAVKKWEIMVAAGTFAKFFGMVIHVQM